jgi:hypothetical protein
MSESTYDIVCQTYYVVRLLEGAVPAVSKEPDPLPTAKANDQPTVQTASGSVREPHSTNLGAAGQFFVATQGAGGGGCCTCNGCT